MKTSMISAALAAAVLLGACTRQQPADSETQPIKTVANQTSEPMKNMISIVEIPTTNLPKAVSFYESILSIQIEKAEMDGIQMGIFPSTGETVNVVLVNGGDYKPSTTGTIVYFNTGNDLQPVLDKVEKNGGKILIPKTQITPEMGYFAMFADTEGNKLGLHSIQ